MSLEIQFELLTTGYVREVEDEYTTIVPDGIKKLILAYYPKKINYIGKFLAENAAPHIKIQSDQLSFNGFRSAKLDQPLPASVTGTSISIVYRWRAVNEAPHGDDAVIFGVVSNRCIGKDFEAYPWESELIDARGISMEDGVIFDGSDDYENNAPDYKAFKQFEIICMEFEISNGNECKLSFYNESKDNEFIYCMNLPNNKEITNWYPVFSKPGTKGLIKMIPY